MKRLITQRKAIHLITLFLIIAGVMLSFIACNSDDDDTDTSLLTEQEQLDLLQLREEEKLARDVYIYAYNLYGLSVFNNISNSEQTHMDQVLVILTAYDMEDPASETVGVFNDEALQTLYEQLIARVDISLEEALQVGATIEDLDIMDIEEFILRTDKEDLITMYEGLMCGSRNHLRSFNAQIISGGNTYTPVYITQTEFEEIIASDHENCGVFSY